MKNKIFWLFGPALILYAAGLVWLAASLVKGQELELGGQQERQGKFSLGLLSTATPTRGVIPPTIVPSGGIRRPTITPTPLPLGAFDFQEITFFGGMGGGDVDMCLLGAQYKSALNSRGPTLFYRDDFERTRLCLIGFPKDKMITVIMTAPDGRKTEKFSVKAQMSNAPEYPRSYAGINFYRGLGLVSGTWTVEASSSGMSAKSTFEIGGKGSAQVAVNHVLPASVFNPLDPRWTAPYTLGEKLVVRGANWPSNTNLPVGIYDNYGKPIGGQVIRTDRKGVFSFSVAISRSYPEGYYNVIPIQDINQKEYSIQGMLTFRVIHPKKVCRDAPMPSINREGYFASILPGPPNNVRLKPGPDNKLLGKIYAYQIVFVVDGPKCADGLVWWYVRDYETGLEGWTGEGDAKGYWLMPLH